MKPEARNPHLDDLDVDFLYHLGLDTTMNLEAMFGDVRYVLMGGSADRAENLANKAAQSLDIELLELVAEPIGKTERYSMFKVGPVISVSHGMGMPSISILLNELAKLFDYAGAEDVKFIRIGTSGGIGVEPGTVVLSTECVNENLHERFEQVILGRTHSYSTGLNGELVQGLADASGEDIKVVLGRTMATNDFYLGQGRMDGALKPPYSEKEKMAFLHLADMTGVKNIEMESAAFAAFCLKAGIPAAVVCTTLLDRLKGDQITSTPEELAQFSANAEELVLRYIQSKLKEILAA